MIIFRKINENDLEMIMRWRIKPEVTRYMVTDLVFDMDKQYAWYRDFVQIHSRPRHWIIRYNDIDIGVLSLDNYEENLQTSWGYYLSDKKYWVLGGLIPAYFYNYMFFVRDLRLTKTVGHLFAKNEKIRKLHNFYGCDELEILRNKIEKNGNLYDILLIELTRKKWLSQEAMFGKYITEFED